MPEWPTGQTFEWVLDQGRRKDPVALSALYRRFLPVVYRFLLARVGGDVPLAEDLTSETFFAVMEGLAAVRAQDELGFASWILGIARNKLGQHYRRQRSRHEVPIAFTEATEPAATAEEDDPLAVITVRENWAETLAALALLTSEQRMVLLHRCILGESTEHVARIMGKPANAIYGLQFRALASLSRHLNRAAHENGNASGHRQREQKTTTRREGNGAG